MNIEADYYENADFWDDAVFANDGARFGAILDLIPADASTLLDVGCGNGAFLHYIMASDRKFDAMHGVDRSKTALSRLKADSTLSSIDALPFADQSFDVLTCLEVIEHLPHGIYEQGLAHLCRIASKYIIIGVPFEEDIEADLIRCPSCTGQFNPDYHLRRYSEDTLNCLLQPHGFEPAGKKMFGPMAEYRFFTAWERRRRHARRGGGNPFSTPIPCPMCGFSLPAGTGSLPSAPLAPERPSRDNGLKGLIKGLLRTGTDYGGIAMLYRRSA